MSDGFSVILTNFLEQSQLSYIEMGKNLMLQTRNSLRMWKCIIFLFEEYSHVCHRSVNNAWRIHASWRLAEVEVGVGETGEGDQKKKKRKKKGKMIPESLSHYHSERRDICFYIYSHHAAPALCNNIFLSVCRGENIIWRKLCFPVFSSELAQCGGQGPRSGALNEWTLLSV